MTNTNSEYEVDIQYGSGLEVFEGQPDQHQIMYWAENFLKLVRPNGAELSVRIVDETEMQALNFQYRKKNKSTNVLSFPAHLPMGLSLPVPLLGDIVICASVVAAEAQEQNKSLAAHWAHMLLHGILHLVGYDHIDNGDAEQMERKEIEMLACMGFANPYE